MTATKKQVPRDEDIRFIHRILQNAHDILAAAWRYRTNSVHPLPSFYSAGMKAPSTGRPAASIKLPASLAPRGKMRYTPITRDARFTTSSSVDPSLPPLPDVELPLGGEGNAIPISGVADRSLLGSVTVFAS